MAYFIDDGGRRLEQFRMEIRKCSPLLQEYIAFLESEYERLSKLHQPIVSRQSEQLGDSLRNQIKRGELDPYSPHAKWIKP